jgi:sacsin
VSSIGKNGSGGDKDKYNNDKYSSSSRRSEKPTTEGNGFNSEPSSPNGFDHSKTSRQTSADSDSSSNTTSESQSESEYAQTNEQDAIDKTELELTKTEIYNAVRQAFQLTGQERKKTVKKLLLKWHPDKNPGRERFAAEVFKHLRKQIDHFENDPLTSFFNTFNNFHHSPFSSSDPKFSWNKHSSTNKTNQQQQQHSASSTTTDDRFGSFDNLNKDPNDETKRSYQDIPNGNNKDHTDNNDTEGNSSKSRFSPHRSSSFRTAREEWQYRRQHGFQRRHGFFSTTEENPTNTNTNGTNSQSSSSSTGGSELFSFCLFLLFIFFNGTRTAFVFFSHNQIVLT